MSKRTAPIDWAEFRDSIGNDQLKLWQYRAACFVEDTDEVRLEIGRKCYEATQAGKNGCLLHITAQHYGTKCICQECSPGAANGLFRHTSIR